MNQFLSEWEKEASFLPIGPLGVIAMSGCEEMGGKIDNWLKKWNSLQEKQDEEFYTMPGADRKSFLIKSMCPRFGTGESKGMLKESVRGYHEAYRNGRAVNWYSTTRVLALSAYDWIWNDIPDATRREIIVPLVRHVEDTVTVPRIVRRNDGNE